MRLSGRKDNLKIVILLSSVALFSVLAVLLYIVFSPRTPVYYEKIDFAMGTRIRIYISSSKINPKDLAEIIMREFRRIDQKFNPYNPESVLYKINHSNGWVKVDKETLALIEAAVGYARTTNGAFDPSLGRLVTLWGFSEFSTKAASSLVPPPADEIKKALKESGYKNILIDSKNSAVKVLNGTWIDLGGMAKGYALERAYKLVKAIDEDSTGFIDAGGDIRIIGPKFGRAYWTIGIKDPRSSGIVDYIYLKDGAVATSGDYERYFIYNGKRYHHILNPKTGYPADGAMSVTVIADDAVKADMLATAGFVMAKDWRYVLVSFPKMGAQIYIVLKNGEKVKSEGFKLYEKKP